MDDSLTQAAQTLSGIPDEGVRLSILVISVFVLCVTIMLMYYRMNEVDRGTK